MDQSHTVKKGLEVCREERSVRSPDVEQIREASGHTQRRYDFIARFYDLMELPVERLLFSKWRPMVWSRVEGPSVLEIGVGTGKNIPYYPDSVTVTGIDLSRKMLEKGCRRAKEHADKSIVLDLMDAQQLKFENNQFDEVVATYAFCSIPDAVAGLQEALRVTRPGGKLQLLEHVRSDKPGLGRLMDLLDGPLHYLSGVHIARETAENVEKAGWKLREDRKLSNNGIFKYIHAVKPA